MRIEPRMTILGSPAVLVAVFVAVFAAVWGLPDRAVAAQDNLTVSVQPRVVEVGEDFNYEVRASTTGNRSIRLIERPNFPSNLRIVGTQNSPSFVIRNGQAQRSLETVYRVRALQAGEYKIPGPKVQIGNATQRGDEVSLEVVPRGKAPEGQRRRTKKNDKLFVDYSLRPSRKVFVGEQITLAYYLFSASVGISSAPQPPDEPSLDEFWIEDLSQKVSGRRETVQVNGRFMERTGLRAYALFPLRAGTTSIEPMTVGVRVGGLVTNTRQVSLSTDTIEVDVQPLPPDEPDSFYDGNVGRWSFRATTDRLTATVGQPVRIRVRAEGSGQVSRIVLPDLPDIEHARMAGSEEQVERRIDGMVVGGSKTMIYTIVPTETGKIDIPALRFSYFDPNAGSYRTRSSEPLSITVKPGGKTLNAQPAPTPDKDEATGSDESVMDTLLGRLRAPTNRLEAVDPPPALLENPLYWSAVALGILALLGLFAEPRIRRWRTESSPDRTRRRAAQAARAQLEKARDETGEDALDEIFDALSSYLVDALDIPRTKLAKSDLERELLERGATGRVGTQAGELAARLDTLRYSPTADVTASTLDELADDVASLINLLEEQRKNGGLSTVAAALLVASITAMVMASPSTVVAQSATAATDVADEIKTLQDAGKWSEASRKWKVVAENQTPNAEILYNLGTTLAHAGQYGHARLVLERASLLAPQRTDIGQNRELVERIVRLRQIEEARGTVRENTTSEGLFWWRLAGQISSNTFPLAGLLFLWAAVVLRALDRVRSSADSKWERWATYVAVSLSLLCALGGVLRSELLDSIEPAVITAEETALKEGPNKHAANKRVSTVLVPGVMLPVVDAREDWVQLEFADGTRAWVSRASVDYVRQR